MSSNLKIKRICAWCGKELIAQKTTTVCCSKDEQMEREIFARGKTDAGRVGTRSVSYTHLSNLLENALEASLRTAPARRRIKLPAYLHGNSLALIQVENTYDGVLRDKGGVFQSSKRKGDGVGLQSVRHIAEKSGGVSTVTYQDGVFCVKVMLCG